MYSSDISFKLFQVLKSNQKQIMNMLSSFFMLLLLLLSRMSWIVKVLIGGRRIYHVKNTDKADNLNTVRMYKARALGWEKRHTFLPHDFMRICTMIHGSAAVWVNPSLPPVPHGRIAAGSHAEEWSNCCDSPTSSRSVPPFAHVFRHIRTCMHPFSYLERFPYQEDDCKYENQTSIHNRMCATSSPFTTCRYSLRVVLLSSEGKQLKRNLRG